MQSFKRKSTYFSGLSPPRSQEAFLLMFKKLYEAFLAPEKAAKIDNSVYSNSTLLALFLMRTLIRIFSSPSGGFHTHRLYWNRLPKSIGDPFSGKCRVFVFLICPREHNSSPQLYFNRQI